MWTWPEAQVRGGSKNASSLESSHFWSKTLQPANHWAETDSRNNQAASWHCPAVYNETSAQESVSPLVKTDISSKPNILPFKLLVCFIKSPCKMVWLPQNPPPFTPLCGYWRHRFDKFCQTDSEAFISHSCCDWLAMHRWERSPNFSFELIYHSWHYFCCCYNPTGRINISIS